MKNVKFWGPLVRDHEEIVALIFFFKKEREPFTPKSSQQTTRSSRGHTPVMDPCNA